MPNVGEQAPPFSAKGTSGPGLKLADLRGKQRALLIFYPMDLTPG